MILLTAKLRRVLCANYAVRFAASQNREREPDPAPVLKLFNPYGPATWLATELYPDGDTLFGLADLGMNCPELGVFSLSEIASVRIPPFGLRIERDRHFVGLFPLSVYAEAARFHGAIVDMPDVLTQVAASMDKDNPELPPEGG